MTEGCLECGHDKQKKSRKGNNGETNGEKNRCCHLEPVPTEEHWKQEFCIVNNWVCLINKQSELDKDRKVPGRDFLFELKNPKELLLDDLKMVILNPKTDGRRVGGDISVLDVIRNMVRDETKWAVVKTKFMRKKEIMKCKLKVTFYSLQDDKWQQSILSETITATNDKHVGSLEIYDIIPCKSCEKGCVDISIYTCRGCGTRFSTV
jgi:hypothetical protein